MHIHGQSFTKIRRIALFMNVWTSLLSWCCQMMLERHYCPDVVKWCWNVITVLMLSNDVENMDTHNSRSWPPPRISPLPPHHYNLTTTTSPLQPHRYNLTTTTLPLTHISPLLPHHYHLTTTTFPPTLPLQDHHYHLTITPHHYHLTTTSYLTTTTSPLPPYHYNFFTYFTTTTSPYHLTPTTYHYHHNTTFHHYILTITTPPLPPHQYNLSTNPSPPTPEEWSPDCSSDLETDKVFYI